MSGQEPFSLDRLEYLVYTQRREEAALELAKLVDYLETHYGRVAFLGDTPSGHLPAEQRDAHFAARIAAAVAALLGDPGFRLSEGGFLRLIALQRWFATIFGASPFRNADHVIWLFNQQGAGQRSQLTLGEAELLKFCLLYFPDSSIPLQPDALWQKSKPVAARLFMALLSSRLMATEQAHAKREQLLAWLPPRLGEVTLDDLPLPILHDAWMHCSYATHADKHALKRALNALVRAKLVSLGLSDVDQRPRERDKPVVLCVLEWFQSGHSIYRTHSLAIEALKARFHVVGVSLRGASDETSRKVFDELHVVAAERPLLEALRGVRDLASALKPDIVYYPSVGMFPETLFLANLRLAPIQAAALGHPATTHSPFIDYVLVEEDYLGDARCFSETVVALPRESLPYRPPLDCPRVAPVVRRAPDPVRVAVAASVMKVNPAFLAALRRIAGEARVEFHFFSLAANGLAKMHLQNVVRDFLAERAVVYPQLPYGRYLERINECDMFVNPFPFGNTNGIVDTVRQGLPGVCLSGPEVHSHIDEGLFGRLGLPSWLVARSPEEYVRAAVRLASDHAERVELSRALLQTQPDEVLFKGNADLFSSALHWLYQTHGRGERPHLLKPPRVQPRRIRST